MLGWTIYCLVFAGLFGLIGFTDVWRAPSLGGRICCVVFLCLGIACATLGVKTRSAQQ